MLEELYVVPERRSEGIGTALIRRSIAEALARGVEFFEVGVDCFASAINRSGSLAETPGRATLRQSLPALRCRRGAGDEDDGTLCARPRRRGSAVTLKASRIVGG